MEKKITKKDYFYGLRAMVEGVEMVGNYPADDVLAFIDKQIAQLDAKAEKARKDAEKRRAAGDALRGKIKALLTNEYQTVDTITDALDDEEVTKAKVVARLGQLVKLGEVEKEQVQVDKRKIMAYRLAGVTTEEDAVEEE